MQNDHRFLPSSGNEYLVSGKAKVYRLVKRGSRTIKSSGSPLLLFSYFL